MRLNRCIVMTVMLLSALASAADATPQRIVSLNLCSDQMLLLLAPERIRMLSQLGTDPAWSWQAARAAGMQRFDGSVESVMKAQPDLILAGSMAQVDSTRLLARLGYRVETLDMPESIDGGLAFITRVADLLGEHGAGARLRADTESRLQRVRAATAGMQRPLALIYLPNGMIPGPGSLKHELLEAAGFRNLAAERGLSGYGSISLEALLRSTPRLMVLETADLEHASLSRQLLRHPALAARIPERTIASSLLVCAGPQMAEAAETLLRFRQELPRNAEPEPAKQPSAGH